MPVVPGDRGRLPMNRTRQKEPMGFAGLASLASSLGQAPGPPAEEIEAEKPQLVREARRVRPSGQAQPSGAKQGRTETAHDNPRIDTSGIDTPRSRRKWLWLVPISAIMLYAFYTVQKDVSILSTPQRELQLADLAFLKPLVGSDNVLNVAEIRWCVREQIRIEALQPLPTTNLQIDEFNELVSDYNSRCGSYRYTRGSLARARQEVEQHRSEIVTTVSRSYLSPK